VSTTAGKFAGIAGLGPVEVRVLGCLLEKQRTTPDSYPLSLNALRLACNQSTNREPVVEYDEPAVRIALHRLERRGLVRLASGAGSRAPKYRHLLADALPLDSAEQAVICVLMLRGAQTPGELKQRTDRMHAFPDLATVQSTLAGLIERGLVERLERRPGQKEERYIQLLESREDGAASAPAVSGAHGAAGDQAGASATAAPAEVAMPGPELDQLRERVERLEREVAELRAGQRGGGQRGPMRDPSV
jgi:uncharacterized protein